MIKKINSSQLKPGMYIHDLNCGWMDHPFVRNQLMLTNEAEIKKIVSHGIREVYIDTQKGLDVNDAPTAKEVRDRIDQEMSSLVEAAATPETPVSFEEEIGRARQVHNEANQIIHRLLKDSRLGKQVELEMVEPVVEKLSSSILRNPSAMLSLCRIKDKDNYTFQHSVSVATLLLAFGRVRQLDAEANRQIGIGGLLHDIGKMYIQDAILNKPGKLTDDEFAHMRSHALHSREVLSHTRGISQIALDVAGQHHERFDGTGYPIGLKGDEISTYGQMAAIVDVYDALTSDRCYHKGMTPTDALRKMFEWSKFHFNQALVQSFIQSVGIYPTGTLVRLESGMLGVVVEQSGSNLLHPRVRVVYDGKRKHFVTPKDVDLSKSGRSGEDRIVGHESPTQWQIDPQKFL